MHFTSLHIKSCRLLLAGVLWLFVCMVYSQELEPRALSMAPTKGNFAVGSYAFSAGNILIDENIPVKDLKANVHSFIGGYARTFKLFNRLAKVDAILPYSLGTWRALVSNVDTSTTRKGFGDPTARISMILIGGPAVSLADYAEHSPSKFRLGVFFRVRMPFGKYDKTTTLNLGANRWAFKTGVGASYRVNKFVFEGYINLWIFTDNKEFLGSDVISQETILTFQAHVTYVMKKGKWLALSAGQSGLGETQINGIPQENRQNNWKFSIALALPLKNNQALKFAFTNGLTTRFGADFSTILVAYQFMWFDKTK